MVTDPLRDDAGIPDIKHMFAAPVGSEPQPDDYCRILRVLLREGLWHVQFMSLFGVGYLSDAVRRNLMPNQQLDPAIVDGQDRITWRDLGLEIELPRNGHHASLGRFFLVVSMLAPCGTTAILEYVPPFPSNRLRLRHLSSERMFFEEMHARGIHPARALRLVYHTLWVGAVFEDPVEPTATRLKLLEPQIAAELQKRGIESW